MAAVFFFLISFSAFASEMPVDIPVEEVRVYNVAVCQGKDLRVLQQAAPGFERVLVEEKDAPAKSFTACRRVDDRRAVLLDCAASAGSNDDIFLVMDKSDKTGAMNGHSLTCTL